MRLSINVRLARRFRTTIEQDDAGLVRLLASLQSSAAAPALAAGKAGNPTDDGAPRRRSGLRIILRAPVKRRRTLFVRRVCRMASCTSVTFRTLCVRYAAPPASLGPNVLAVHLRQTVNGGAANFAHVYGQGELSRSRSLPR